jgi:hypothetical protein
MDTRQLETLCDEITMSLNHRARFVGMKGEFSDQDAHFETPNGAQFYIRIDTHTHRLSVNGHYNGLWKFRNSYNNPAPSITVSPDRTPAQIARDIERRFLPDFLEDYARTQANKTRHMQEIDQTLATAQTVIDASGDYYHRPHGSQDHPLETPRLELYSYGAAIFGKANVSTNSVDMELQSLTASEAAQVIALVSSFEKERKAK